MGRRLGRRRAPFKLNLKKDTVYSVGSILCIGIGVLLMVSFTRQTTILQKVNIKLTDYVGWTSLIVPFLFIAAGLMLTQLKWRITRPNVLVGALLLFASLAAVTRSGILGREVWLNISALVSTLGAGIIFVGLVLAGIIVMTEMPLDQLLLLIPRLLSAKKSLLANKNVAGAWQQAGGLVKMKGIAPAQPSIEEHKEKKDSEEKKKETPQKSLLESQPLSNVPGSSATVWEYPPLSLLNDGAGGNADRGDVKKNADIIEQTLDSFGIKARVAEVNGGPAITQYALEIALGTKLAKITALQNDLALALSAPTGQIRIEAPIPGRNLVGIEIPNHSPEFVSLKKMLTSKQLKNNPSKLAVGLGLNVSGESVVVDIEKMPHILIAGSTGSGKSVSINAFLCTILYRASPEEVKLMLVDPKRVELTGYNGIPHLLTPVIVDPNQVVSALRWALKEMERRYKIFAEVGVRNIQSYNEMSGFQAMPYLLIVIDELADIMLFAPSEVEDLITRLAQMARATGIHLIVSTQRPSTDVITGLIKANIPCRIAFNVTSMVDSRVIIDMPGAEKLLGKGDMLYIPPDQAKPTRIQGAYLSDREIDNLIGYLKQQGIEPTYDQAVTEKYQPRIPGSLGGSTGEVDELLERAIEIVTQSDRASASLLQRRLSIGYARAARILDQLQEMGIVGPAEGAKPREVLIKNASEVLSKLRSDGGDHS